MWFLLQSSIIFAVCASNIRWHCTPNGYLASIIGIGLAWLVTLCGPRLWKHPCTTRVIKRTASPLESYRGIVQRVLLGAAPQLQRRSNQKPTSLDFRFFQQYLPTTFIRQPKAPRYFGGRVHQKARRNAALNLRACRYRDPRRQPSRLCCSSRLHSPCRPYLGG